VRHNVPEGKLIPDQNKMKLPKEIKRYCPYCRKHTIHTVGTAKQKARSSAHPLSRWSNARTKARSYRSGTGNLGRFSKPAVKSWKRKTKTTKRITVQYKCKECNKIHQIKKAIRTGRIEIGQTVAK
jgi:large subunit ribosomal protein L44e